MLRAKKEGGESYAVRPTVIGLMRRQKNGKTEGGSK
jgi:hypothetical protein